MCLSPPCTIYFELLCSVVILRPWSWDLSAVEFILSRSRSRDLKTQVVVLVSRPEVQGLGLGLKTACLVSTPVARLPLFVAPLSECSVTSWTWCSQCCVHSSSFCPGLGLETWSPRYRSQSWFRDLKTKVSVLVSRPKKGLDNNSAPMPRCTLFVLNVPLKTNQPTTSNNKEQLRKLGGWAALALRFALLSVHF